MSERLARAVAQLRAAVRDELPADLQPEALVALLGVSAAVRRAELRAMPQHEVKRASAIFKAELIGDPTR
jgi:hypothetical protein